MNLKHIAACIFLLATAGCGKPALKDAPGVVILSVYNYASPEFLTLYEKLLIPACERTHPNIRAKMNASMGDQGYDAKLLPLIADGMPPDLFHATQRNFPFYAARDVVMPLGKMATSEPAFGTFLKNTLAVAILAPLGQTLSSATVAYAFARMRFPYRNALFVLVRSTMMLPPQVTMIPSFILFTLPRWIDSLKPLIVPAYFGGGAFSSSSCASSS
jgi:ABC-type glycerol-3-phosphate transport system permease component